MRTRHPEKGDDLCRPLQLLSGRSTSRNLCLAKEFLLQVLLKIYFSSTSNFLCSMLNLYNDVWTDLATNSLCGLPWLTGWWLQIFDSAHDNIIYPVTAKMSSGEYCLIPPQTYPWKACRCLWIHSFHGFPLKKTWKCHSHCQLKTNARLATQL